MTAVAEHLERLIRIPTVSALSNRPLVDYAASVLAAQGWTMRELPYTDDSGGIDSGTKKLNLIAAPPGQDPAARTVDLALLCHTDTVPYAADWPHALHAIRHGDNLHGCGACDVKGFLACLLAAAQSANARSSEGLRIVLTADEEIGCIGSKRLIEADCLAPRRLVIGEPTSLRAARAGKGYCLARIVLHGREAHSALPAQGLSAIYPAAHIVAALEQLARDLTGEQNSFFDPPCTTVNVGVLNGGSAKNIVPGRAELLVEWRPIPAAAPTTATSSSRPERSAVERSALPSQTSLDPQSLQSAKNHPPFDRSFLNSSPERIPAFLRARLSDLEIQYPGLKAELILLRQQAGFETSASSRLVRAVEQAAGLPAVSIAFGSEASLWSPLVEEVVVFGPGDMRTAHSSRECVPLAELDRAVDFARGLMQGHALATS